MTTPIAPSGTTLPASPLEAAARGWSRVRLAEVVFWSVAFATIVFAPRHHLILNEIAILALFALSLDLILGYAGIVSLGHAAYLGFGAYAAGLFAKHVSADPLSGLGAAAVASAALGYITSVLVMRGNDLTRLLMTLGISLMLYEIANKWSSVTGGADGLQGITMAPILGRYAFDLRGTTAFCYSLAVLFVLFLIARRIVHAPIGLSLKGIRDNPMRARAVGVPVQARLRTVYTLSAMYAGVAGALLCQTTQFASLDVFSVERSADVMLMLIIGGTGYLYGGIGGAIAFKLLEDVLKGMTAQYWQFWIGLILVVFVLIGRERLTGWPKTLWARMRGAAP
jgi:branched-chain amino acid transport system permease protein